MHSKRTRIFRLTGFFFIFAAVILLTIVMVFVPDVIMWLPNLLY